MLEGVVAGRWEGREKEVHADVPSEQFAKVSDYCFVLLGRMLGVTPRCEQFQVGFGQNLQIFPCDWGHSGGS